MDTSITIKKPVIVVGATGFLGSEICRQLISAGTAVKGLVRSSSEPAKVGALEDLGVKTVVGDIKDRQSLMNAFQNVSAVISTASSTLSRQEGDNIDTVDRDGQLNVVDAAIDAGVEQLIFISFSEASAEFPLQSAKRAVEKKISESNLKYTILQPTFFMEVWLSPAIGFDYANAKATIYGNGKSKLTWIAIPDVAAFAVDALGNPAFFRRTFQLGGPEPLSPLEVVEIFEEIGGIPFTVTHVPEEALRAQKAEATDPLQKSFAGLMIAYAEGNNIDMKKALDIFPIKLTSVKEYAGRIILSLNEKV